jgi:hypothetical protein
MESKICRKCGETKPFSDFHKDRNSKDGLQSRCKPCGCAASRAYQARNAEKVKAAQAEWRQQNADIIAARNAAYYASRAEQEKARAKAYREANPEKHWNATKKWREENADRHKEMTRAWREANADHVRAKRSENHHDNKERELSRNRQWKRNNRHMVRAYDSRRRVAEGRATPSWASQEKILEFYFAADFLGMVTGDWYHVDHIVPLQSKVVCGLHCETNLQVLPALENFSKGNRHWPDMP